MGSEIIKELKREPSGNFDSVETNIVGKKELIIPSKDSYKITR